MIISNIQDNIVITQSLEELIIKVANITLSEENVTGNVELSIVLVDDNYIRELNRQYRSLDTPTDVLSFAMRETCFEETIECFEFQEEELLGDVVVSLERAEKQAIEYGHSFEREVGFLVVHGVLHLLGYDHEVDNEKAVMRFKEEKILEIIDLIRGIK